ncbi:MAG: hypothetical protein ABIO94_04655 [Opitutaceae bacterium]
MIRFLLCFLLVAGLLHGQLPVTDLDVPFFDRSSGRLLRRLKAASAIASPETALLKSGTVEFFGSETSPGKIGTLTFDNAAYRASADVIESEGPMQLRFVNGTLSAVGFRYEFLNGRLILKSAVVLDSAEAHAVGREGEALISQNKADKDMLVSVATIRGDVVITEIKVDNVAVERVETASASYTGEDGLLRPATPVIFWSKGERVEMSGKNLSWPISRRASPLAAPAAQESPATPAEKSPAPTPRR